MGDEPDVWAPAFVQRNEAWDQVRMRHLLDSLLAGYPIGGDPAVPPLAATLLMNARWNHAASPAGSPLVREPMSAAGCLSVLEEAVTR